MLFRSSGTVSWGDTITWSYFPKDNSRYFEEKRSLLEWLRRECEEEDPQVLRGFLGRMLFSGEAVEKNVAVLSGGEKARAMFSRMMMSGANTLVFDEPTDHLDLEAISSLNESLEQFRECLIFSSHDFQLLNTVANRIIEVSGNGMLDRRASFNDYMQNEQLQGKRESLYKITV